MKSMYGGGGSGKASDRREARAAKKIEKLDTRIAKKALKSSNPISALEKGLTKFEKKSQKITDRYNKKK
jgi:hypothetical protein